MEAELAAKLAQVEHEAQAATTQLEQQLISHAQAMMQRERRAIQPHISAAKPQVEVFFKDSKSESAAA